MFVRRPEKTKDANMKVLRRIMWHWGIADERQGVTVKWEPAGQGQGQTQKKGNYTIPSGQLAFVAALQTQLFQRNFFFSE